MPRDKTGGNGKWLQAQAFINPPSGTPATESEPIRDRCDIIADDRENL